MKKVLSIILSLILALSAFAVVPAETFADTALSEIRIMCDVSSVSPGTLPSFTPSSSTAHVTSVDAYGSNSNWVYWNGHTWCGFGGSTPTATDDGKTHYALAVCVELESGYSFDENTRIYLNGTEYTSLGHSMINVFSWGGNVYLDLGTAGAETPIYTITYNANGGTNAPAPQTVYAGESKHLRGGNEVTAPSGMSFVAWEINGVQHEQYSEYKPTGNVTAYAVWTDKYIRESRATMTPSALTADICANDLVVTSSEPTKYSAELWRVFDKTDTSLNTNNGMYPFDKNFIQGHQYAIEYTFSAAGNYYEYDEITNISTFYINNKLTDISAAVAISGSTNRRLLFTCGEDPYIKTVDTTVTAPAAGGAPTEKPVTSTAYTSVTDYDWYENGEKLTSYDTFRAGHTYKLQIRVSTTKKFNNKTTATINGKTAMVKSYDNNSILFYCDFTLPAPTGYTVSYNAGEGSGTMTSDTGVLGNYPLRICEFTAPDSKEFKCWRVGGVEQAIGTPIDITADTVVTAVWQDIQDSHTHNFEILRSDADNHWYECSCGTKKYADYHSFKTVVAPATFDTPGSFVQQCSVCGYEGDVDWGAILGIKSVKLSKTSFVYNGKVQKPTVKILDSNGKAISKDYYKITYITEESKKVGTYKVKITMKGYYYGKKVLTYKINPKGTSLSKVTAPEKAQLKIKWKKQASQTTGYQIQYSTSSRFTKKTTKTLTVKKNKTTSAVIKKLKSKKKYYIRIKTYKTVGKKKYYSAWSKTKSIKTK